MGKILFGVVFLGLSIMAFKAVWTVFRAVVTAVWNLVTALVDERSRPKRREEAPLLRMPIPDREWQRLSREIREAIRVRRTRDPRAQRIAELELEIQIEQLEIELARLKAEKAAFKKRTRKASEDGQLDLFTADRSPAQAQLEAMRGVLGRGTGRMQDPGAVSPRDRQGVVLGHGSVRPTAGRVDPGPH